MCSSGAKLVSLINPFVLSVLQNFSTVVSLFLFHLCYGLFQCLELFSFFSFFLLKQTKVHFDPASPPNSFFSIGFCILSNFSQMKLRTSCYQQWKVGILFYCPLSLLFPCHHQLPLSFFNYLFQSHLLCCCHNLPLK